MCRADVERLILDKPRVGLQLAYLLGERLATHETRMEDMAVPARLASLILLLVENEGVRTLAGYKIPTRYTHHQLGRGERQPLGEAVADAPGAKLIRAGFSGFLSLDLKRS